MGRYIARRLLQGLVVIFGVTVFVFVVTRLIGDPVKFMLPLSATEEEREATRAALGLDEPIPRQFVTFLGDLVRLDLGESTYVRGQSALVGRGRLPAAHVPTGRRSGWCSRSC